MKKVWVSALIALALIVGSIFYYNYQRQKYKAIEEHVAELTAPQPQSVAVREPHVDTDFDLFDETSDDNPLNLDVGVLEDEECCPDKEVAELYDIHRTSDTFIEEKPRQISEKSVELTGNALIKQQLIEKYGYSPDIDRYLELSDILVNGKRKGLETMLEWARLEVKYNPSQDVRELLNDFEEIAKNPELIIDFWFQ